MLPSKKSAADTQLFSKPSTDTWWWICNTHTRRIAYAGEQLCFFPYFMSRISSTDIVSLCYCEQWAHSLLLPADCGHFVHRPLRAAGSGECGLPCGILPAASISFPGASLCQGLTNALGLPRSRLATVSRCCSTQLWTSGADGRHPTPTQWGLGLWNTIQTTQSASDPKSLP